RGEGGGWRRRGAEESRDVRARHARARWKSSAHARVGLRGAERPGGEGGSLRHQALERQSQAAGTPRDLETAGKSGVSVRGGGRLLRAADAEGGRKTQAVV